MSSRKINISYKISDDINNLECEINDLNVEMLELKEEMKQTTACPTCGQETSIENLIKGEC
jgi:DNA repair exonuclease SbcCD ATPase subunit